MKFSEFKRSIQDIKEIAEIDEVAAEKALTFLKRNTNGHIDNFQLEDIMEMTAEELLIN